jgi:polysaccharide deacetylase 2 family uncharacterized protein YibQ
MTDERIRLNIEHWLREFPNVIGATNYMGSKVAQLESVLNTTFAVLKQNNLFFVDNFLNNNTDIKLYADRNRLKIIPRDLYLDVPNTSLRNARTRVSHIQQIKNRDYIVVMTHAHSDVKFRQLEHFIDRLKDEGYQLMPITYALPQGL